MASFVCSFITNIIFLPLLPFNNSTKRITFKEITLLYIRKEKALYREKKSDNQETNILPTYVLCCLRCLLAVTVFTFDIRTFIKYVQDVSVLKRGSTMLLVKIFQQMSFIILLYGRVSHTKKNV